MGDTEIYFVRLLLSSAHSPFPKLGLFMIPMEQYYVNKDCFNQKINVKSCPRSESDNQKIEKVEKDEVNDARIYDTPIFGPTLIIIETK